MSDQAKIDAAINGDYTPGPWEIEYGQVDPRSEKEAYTIRTDAFDVVSGHLLIRREADATLIAAAPDLAVAYREQQEQLRLYREGYQGSCIACEPVALRNRELEERLHVQKQAVRRLRWVIKEMRFRGLPPQVDLLAAQALAGKEIENDG